MDFKSLLKPVKWFTQMRFRHLYMLVGTIIVLGLMILSDPDLGYIKDMPIGASTVATLLLLSKLVLYVAALHMSRKALMDYKEANLQELFRIAKGTPEGAGKAIIGMALMMVAISILVVAAVIL